MNLKIKIINIYYRLFRKIIFNREMKKRRLINEKKNKYRLIGEFRKLETALRPIKYPKNDFNKIMSMILSDITLFGHIVDRYRRDREMLKDKTLEENFYYQLNSNAKSYPSHPAEEYISNSIKVDTKSLFIFGTILVNRSLLLLKMYLPDKHNSGSRSMYSSIGYFYPILFSKKVKISPLLKKIKSKFSINIKWLYSVLRFYRNEFIEHLDKNYQQGMVCGVYTDTFSLSNYKQNYNNNDNKKIENLKLKLEKVGIHIAGRNDGGRNMINRYYLQRVFDNITQVPNDLLDETLKLVEDIGGESPQPNRVIEEIENYITNLFQFMVNEFESSELAKYREKNEKGDKINL